MLAAVAIGIVDETTYIPGVDTGVGDGLTSTVAASIVWKHIKYLMADKKFVWLKEQNRHLLAYIAL